MNDNGDLDAEKFKAMAATDPVKKDGLIACVKPPTPGASPCQKAYDFLECTFQVCM